METPYNMELRRILPTIVAILILGIIFLVIIKNVSNKDGGLVAPTFIQQITSQQSSPSPTAVPTPNAPKTFQFDSSTDLKAELEKVNPQVLDSDFE